MGSKAGFQTTAKAADALKNATMTHLSLSTSYHQLAVRLNKFPQGAPPSKLLYEILAILFSEEEARLVAQLPIRVFGVKRASRAWQMPLAQTQKILDSLCRKALLIDIAQNGETVYVLPPPMAGFFEFSLMRQRSDIDQKRLAQNLYRYINMEEDFAQALFTRGHTTLGRVFVNEAQIPPSYSVEVLDHERTSHVIRTAEAIAVGQCYCRHKMSLMDQACDAPQDICLTFNFTATALIRHGHARSVGIEEAHDIVQKANSHHLVQFGENVRQQVNFVCNCCKCCCEGMQAARRFAMAHPVQTTQFLPAVSIQACTGCGRCIDLCPVAAVTLMTTDGKRPRARIEQALCLGCGVCARACPAQAITLHPRARRMVTPLNTAHRVMLMAVERGTLQHIIFDNQVLYSHKALATLLGVFLRLPAAKKLLAAKLLKSRYFESLLSRLEWQPRISQNAAQYNH